MVVAAGFGDMDPAQSVSTKHSSTWFGVSNKHRSKSVTSVGLTSPSHLLPSAPSKEVMVDFPGISPTSIQEGVTGASPGAQPARVKANLYSRERQSESFNNLATQIFRESSEPKLCEEPLIFFFSYYDVETGALDHAGCMRIHHKSLFRKIWDGMCAILLIWMSLSLPITVGFAVSSPFLNAVSTMIDVIFLLDLMSGFFTTFEDENKVTVTDLSVIAKEYLSGWFVVDFVSSLPLQWLGLELYVPTAAFRAVKLLKLLKLLRIFRLGRLLGKIQERFQIKHATIMIFQFIFIILFAAHWLGCLYFYVTDHIDEQYTWLTQYLSDTGNPIGQRGMGEKYVASLYWALTTMSTIGYGDIIPVSTAERILTTAAMIIGACTFAYGLTNVCTLLFNHNRRKVEFETLTDEMNDFLSDYKFAPALCQQVQSFLWYTHHSSHINENRDQVERLLSRLSPELREKVVEALMERIFRKHDGTGVRTLWSYFDDRLLCELARSMIPQAHGPGEHIIGGMLSHLERMEPYQCPRRVSLITKGECTAAFAGSEKIYDLCSGSSFGERSVLFGTTLSNIKVVTRGYCDVYCLTEEIAQGIFQLYPVVHACLNYIFRDRNLDIVLSEEVGTINDKIQAYLQEKQEEFTLASEVRALAVAEDERVAMLADVILASPCSSVVTAELEQVQSEIATTQNHLRKLLDQRQKLIATSAQTEDKASPAEAGVEPSKNDEQPLEQAPRPTLQTPEVLEVVEAKCVNDTQIESPDTPKTIAANESTQF